MSDTPSSRTQPTGVLYRSVRMTFDHEHIDAFLRIFAEVRPHIEAVEGCLSLKLLRDADQPDVLTTYSTWASDAALQAYRRSDFFRQTWSRTRELFCQKPVAHSYHEHIIG